MYKLVGCSVLALVFVGCGSESGDANRPDTSPVTGVVTYNGEAVEGATVTFLATSAGGRGATGLTDASGKFALLTFAPGDGVIPGSYAVTVSKTSGGEIEMDEDGLSVSQDATATEVKDLLPAKYKDKGTSGLTADVNEAGGEFTFELTD